MREEIVPATMEHAVILAERMRQADKDEVLAQSGAHPAFALGASLAVSEVAWTGLVDGEIVAMWGVGRSDELDDTVGVPWLLGTDLVEKHARRFLIHSRPLLEQVQERFPVLENHVDARNTVAIRWLRWLGFDIFATVPYGPYKLPFHPFRRVRN